MKIKPYNNKCKCFSISRHGVDRRVTCAECIDTAIRQAVGVAMSAMNNCDVLFKGPLGLLDGDKIGKQLEIPPDATLKKQHKFEVPDEHKEN